MSQFKKFCIFSLVGVLVASFYPIFMGLKVIDDMVRNGWFWLKTTQST